MSIERLNKVLTAAVNDLKEKGTAKADEMVITGMKPADGELGVRYYVEGYGDKEFIKMNSNSYLGLSLHPEVIKAVKAVFHVIKEYVSEGEIHDVINTLPEPLRPLVEEA